ncbi:hypothetical protein [Parasitella parasitica]|uniref:Uncharacterized protein n=1 Tax=Parasitella parasitica TaxID=35722 RepID=A0A0B7MVP1_9FUNG|nr:hypothetical protein [Parasitella parasitica]
MKMYYDLNIPYSEQADRSAVDRLKLILSRLTQLNEATVALNYTTGSKPINESIFDPSILNSVYPLTCYKRVTVESIDLQQIADLRDQFDLIAMRTNDYDEFHKACQSDTIDIISLHVDERLSFELNAVDIKNALQNNIYFEICYAPAIRDNQARIYTLQLAKQLFEYTQGQHVIISSEAQTVSEIRNPADVFYFAKSIGFPNDKAKFTSHVLLASSLSFRQYKMSYHYQNYSRTTTTTSLRGQTHTTSTARTTTSSSVNGTSSSVVVREISENELNGLTLESTQDYEITDDDSLTKYDFYSLMDSQDEDSETESESDIEYHWFPSLLNSSFIEILDDKEQEAYMDDDTYDAKVQIEEESTTEDKPFNDDEEEDDVVQHEAHAGKRYHKRHAKKHSKKPRRSEQVPVEVIHIVL